MCSCVPVRMPSLSCMCMYVCAVWLLLVFQIFDELRKDESLYYDEDGYVRCGSAKFVNYLQSLEEVRASIEAAKHTKRSRKREISKRMAAAVHLISAAKAFVHYGRLAHSAGSSHSTGTPSECVPVYAACMCVCVPSYVTGAFARTGIA